MVNFIPNKRAYHSKKKSYPTTNVNENNKDIPYQSNQIVHKDSLAAYKHCRMNDIFNFHDFYTGNYYVSFL